jgi:hypothetical protein
MKWWLCLLVVFIPNAFAETPRFGANQIQSNSRSVSKIDEVIITENYNSGYAYSVTGSNIKIKDGTVISPEAVSIINRTQTIETTQTSTTLFQ